MQILYNAILINFPEKRNEFLNIIISKGKTNNNNNKLDFKGVLLRSRDSHILIKTMWENKEIFHL